MALLTDTTAPETTLVRGPASPNPNAATFEFGGTDDLFSNQQALRFECSLNGGLFTTCANPASFSGLPGGNLTLAVRAQDAAGNVDASPATYTWTQCGDAISEQHRGNSPGDSSQTDTDQRPSVMAAAGG